MSCAIRVIHRKGAENAENAEEFSRKTRIYFGISVLRNPLRSLRLSGKSIRARVVRRAP